MNTRTVYKVCYDGKSWSGNVRYSKLGLKYEVGVTTYPKVGKILVFSKAIDAVEFILDKSYEEEYHAVSILEGQGENPGRIKYLTDQANHRGEMFWENKKKKKKSMNYEIDIFAPPHGTLAVSSFTPTKEYEVKEFMKMVKGE
jgi:hypothetical protein